MPLQNEAEAKTALVAARACLKTALLRSARKEGNDQLIPPTGARQIAAEQVTGVEVTDADAAALYAAIGV